MLIFPAYFTMANQGETPLGVPYFIMYKDPTIFEEKYDIAGSRGYTKVRRFNLAREFRTVRNLPAARDPEMPRQL